MNITDCHCHVYPDALAAKAVGAISSFYDLKATDDMLKRGTVSDMIRREHGAGVGHQVIFSVATTPHQVSTINHFIARDVEKSGGTLTGLGTVHPNSLNLKADIDEIISLGLKGIKIHPDFQQTKADDYRYLKVYEYCEGRLPILIHCGDYRKDYSNPNRILPILEIFTGLTVIGAHLGGWSVWDEAVKCLPGHENFYVDCSSVFEFTGKEKACEIMKAYGADKILFGTDYPMKTPEEELKTLFGLGFSTHELDLITHLNAEKIFGINTYAVKYDFH